MSRFGIEDDDREWDVAGVNARCTDCGADYGKADADPSTWCDGCSDRRDVHLDALEIRLAMAKADLPATSIPRVPVVVEVALVPVPPIRESAAYLAWLDALRANAHYGSDALARAWYEAPTAYQCHLLTVPPDLWLTLKAVAIRQVA